MAERQNTTRDKEESFMEELSFEGNCENNYNFNKRMVGGVR